MASSATTILEQLAPDARRLIVGTPLEEDPVRLQQLIDLDAADQAQVLRLHLSLTVPWDHAIASFLTPDQRPKSARGAGDIVRPDSDALPEAKHGPTGSGPLPPTVVLAEKRITVGGEQGTRQVIRVRLTELRPNPVNSTIYSESLGDAKLRDLADHIARYGQQDPIIADTSLMILEGERRWRALGLIRAKYADVIVDTRERSTEEIEDLVLDAFSLKRKPSVFEQLQLYKASVRSYTRRYGRAPGRPRKLDKILSGFWDANRVKEEAATAAGLGSRETARLAIQVMERADLATKEAMLSREMSISAAYATLRSVDQNDTEGKTGVPDDEPEKQLGSPPPHRFSDGSAGARGGDHNEVKGPAGSDKSPSTPSSKANARQPPASKTRTRRSSGTDDERQGSKSARPAPHEGSTTKAKASGTTPESHVLDNPSKALPDDDVKGKSGMPSEPASDSSGRSNGIIQGEQQTNETRRGATPGEQKSEQDRTGDDHRNEHDVGESPADAEGEVGSGAKRLKHRALNLGRQLRGVISKMADDDFDDAAAVLDEIFAELTEALGERQDEPEDDESPGEGDVELAEMLDGI